MIKVKIKELISKKISGEWGKEPEGDAGVYVIRTANFTNEGRINYSNILKRDIELKKIQNKKLLLGDTIIEKSGGSPKQPVGRVVYFDIDDKETYLCNNFTSILRPDTSKVDPKFFFYRLYINHKRGLTLRYQNKTTGIINLKLDKYLEKSISIPERIEDQLRTATLLSRVEEVIVKRKESIRLLDELLKSTFWGIFRLKAPGKIPWKNSKLGNVADVVSGLTKGKKYIGKKTISVPYMRVANVQDGYLDLDDIKQITATPAEVERFRLKNEDILLTEGGDPDKLGRGAVWANNVPNCIYQNHIFRVRIKDSKIKPAYLSALIGSVYGKKYFIRAAKQTTGIATINSKQLKNFTVIIPPIKLQAKFVQIVEKVETMKSRYHTSLHELENLYGSLSQRAFREELDLSGIPVELSGKAEIDTKQEATLPELEVIPKDQKKDADKEHKQLADKLIQIIKKKFKTSFTFNDLWDNLIKEENSKSDNLSLYEEVKSLIFKWLAGKHPFLMQLFDENKKETVLKVTE